MPKNDFMADSFVWMDGTEQDIWVFITTRSVGRRKDCTCLWLESENTRVMDRTTWDQGRDGFDLRQMKVGEAYHAYHDSWA